MSVIVTLSKYRLKDEGKVDVVKKNGPGNPLKKESDKKNKEGVSTGDGLVNGSEKKTTKKKLKRIKLKRFRLENHVFCLLTTTL